ncbi:hypothetical protein ATK86_7098 [Nocardia fluminea]|uniref:Uncharacterized protein n=1 Tax=Nocardia fluminea TaxID=134984 RepID=A0A2N3V4Z5_9NOCA|nr:hypothetical protein ATK86_7098 [Nocardia fluminea]
MTAFPARTNHRDAKPGPRAPREVRIVLIPPQMRGH